MVGRSHDRGAHQQRRRGLVAAHQQHDAVERVARGSIPRRPSRPGCGTASSSAASASRRGASPGIRAESRRPRARRSARARRGPEMRVARRGLRPGVADADHRAAVELIVRECRGSSGTMIVEPHLVLPAEPSLAAQRFLLGHRQPPEWRGWIKATGVLTRAISAHERQITPINCVPQFWLLVLCLRSAYFSSRANLRSLSTSKFSVSVLAPSSMGSSHRRGRTIIRRPRIWQRAIYGSNAHLARRHGSVRSRATASGR